MTLQKNMKRLGDDIHAVPAGWSFEHVAETFAQHIRRSVPLYDEGHDLICQISDYFIRNDSVAYDLGASTGELLSKLAARHEGKSGAMFIGIDNQDGMVKHARKSLGKRRNIRFESGDINLWDYEAADFMAAFYTVQFVPPKLRQDLINKIYRSLNWGGAFLFFEKVRAPDARFQDLCTGIYTDFKLEHGFTEAEIVNKSLSLKAVLEPFSSEGNLALLKRAGFVDIMTVIKYVPFEGLLAIK